MGQQVEEQHSLHEMFHYLHEHPEVSWKEIETTNYLAKQIRLLGLEPVLFHNCTGLYVEVGQGEATVGVRSDIDALWQEVDGELRANHSCGHDAHMSIVFAVLKKLQEQSEKLTSKVRFIFQPAEEKGQGALKLMEHNVVDGLVFLFGLHLRPIQEVPLFKASSSIHHGAAMILKGTIIGEDAHAARPHLGINTIEVAASLVQHLQAIRLNPLEPFSVKMTQLHAGGESGNIIPGKATFTLDARAQSNNTMEQLKVKIFDAMKVVSEYFKANITFDIHSDLVAAVVNDEAENLMRKAIHKVLGENAIAESILTPGGEDFHFYGYKNPGLKTTMLGLGCNLSPGLHHPKMKFDHSALQLGVDILYEVVQDALEKV